MPRWENKRYNDFTRAEWRDYLLGSYQYKRRARWRSAWIWLKWEVYLWARLPGDTVNSVDQDCVYLIHGGRPGDLRGWAISGYAIALHVGTWRTGEELWPLVAHNPPETWLANLTKVRV